MTYSLHCYAIPSPCYGLENAAYTADWHRVRGANYTEHMYGLRIIGFLHYFLQLTVWSFLVKMATQLTSTAVVSLLNGGGGVLLGSGDDDALMDVLFTDNTQCKVQH